MGVLLFMNYYNGVSILVNPTDEEFSKIISMMTKNKKANDVYIFITRKVCINSPAMKNLIQSTSHLKGNSNKIQILLAPCFSKDPHAANLKYLSNRSKIVQVRTLTDDQHIFLNSYWVDPVTREPSPVPIPNVYPTVIGTIIEDDPIECINCRVYHFSNINGSYRVQETDVVFKYSTVGYLE
jgi:hypothetical protein